MAAEGRPFTGFLYAGVMIDGEGRPRTLEFNCRMGDPEAEPILMRMKCDFLDLVQHATDGTLDKADAQWDRRTALGVVVAAAGYPESPRRGDAIHGLDDGDATGAARTDEDAVVKVFHAGTVQDGDAVRVNGGRVLCVTALGDSVRQAQKRAYDAIAGIGFDGMQYRTDIGHRALAARKA
jgi:phosphoribosylamine--glycine ligase